jgi:hypothetical protein
VGEYILDDFAVGGRNIATCVVDVASHHVVGEVRLQNDVLGVHMNLERRNRGRGSCQGGHTSPRHQGRWWRGRWTDRYRDDRGDRDMKRDYVRPRELEISDTGRLREERRCVAGQENIT